jgi:hypothetical protein
MSSSTIRSQAFSDLKIQEKCIQLDGQDQILREYQFAGPTSGRDTRLVLDKETIGFLMDVVRESDTSRLIIYGAGINVKVRRTDDGHVYETLHILGHKPSPEKLSKNMSLSMPRSQAQAVVNGWNK